MRLDISGIQGRKGAFFQVKRELPSEFLESVPEVTGVFSPVEARLTVTNTGEAFLVTGELSAEVELRCSRCLKPLRTMLKAALEEEFYLEPQLEDEDPFTEQLLVEGGEIDTTDVIQESLLVSVPMKPVCSPDCPGLCSVCGKALADGPCGCTKPDVDVRLAPLLQLMEKSAEATTPERRKEHGSTKEKTVESTD